MKGVTWLVGSADSVTGGDSRRRGCVPSWQGAIWYYAQHSYRTPEWQARAQATMTCLPRLSGDAAASALHRHVRLLTR